MANGNSPKSISEKIDSYHIQVMESGGRTPMGRGFFPRVSGEKNRPGQNLQGEDDERENATESGSNYEASGDFDAVPEEFRPSRRGKDLMKVRTSPKKEDSKEKMSADEPLQSVRFLNKPTVLQRKEELRNSNSSTIQNDITVYKKEQLKTKESEQRRRVIDMISDEIGKQKKSSEMFFYHDLSQSESTAKTIDGRQQNRSKKENSRESLEKSKLKNAQDEKTYRIFHNPENSQLKATKDFNIHSSFKKNKERPNFNKHNKKMIPKYQDRNANNHIRDKDETNFTEYYKNMPLNFQDKTGSSQNRTLFVDVDAQKITREVTVEKRIKWKNNLCEFKKSESKSNYFYKYTKTTQESVSYVPSHNEDDNEDNKETTKSCQNFKKENNFCNNTRRKNFENYRQRFVKQKDKEFYSTYMTQRNEAKHFVWESPQEPVNKSEKKHSYFQCSNDKDPIIIKHEIKVIHVNRQGKDNRMFQDSSQTFRPYKERNRKIVNTYTINKNGKIVATDYGERNDKISKNDSRERNDEMINTDTREYCGVKLEENIIKTEEVFQRTRKDYVRIPLKLPSSSLKTENTCNNYSLNSENRAVLIRYGREISDLIAGSYVAISTFLDNYEQWKDFRHVTMLLFEEVEKNLSQSCYRNKRIIEVAELVGSGCKMIQYVPHVGVSVAAKVIAFLSDVVAKIFFSSNSAKSIRMEDFQLKLSLQRDMEATSDIYVYGMQCDINFHETRQLIEEFHREIQDGRFKEFEETFETDFLREMFLLNPKHPEVFYKKLGRFYKLLNEHQVSEEGRAFCAAFEDWPDALATVTRLHRRFRTENWNKLSVLKAWEEVYNLLQSNHSTVKDVLEKIQDCICVLIREQNIMEVYVRDLQSQC